MRTRDNPYFRAPACVALGLVLLLLASAGARAEDAIDWGRDSIIPFNLDADPTAAPAAPRPHRIRLFRITPGFLSDPVGLTDPSDPTAADDGPDWVQVSMGADNPFFDLRRPGDPGGVGYYRIDTQMQLFDSRTTGCAVGLQAVTPAGEDNAGLEDGPTVVSPSLSLFHTLDDGTAIQGFVGKHVHLDSGLGGRLGQSVQYGMAVQRPLLPTADGSGSLYVFMEALGRFHYESQAAGAAPHVMEVLPGLHWQVGPNWWMSGAFVLPVNTAPTSVNQWQITCSFHF